MKNAHVQKSSFSIKNLKFKKQDDKRFNFNTPVLYNIEQFLLYISFQKVDWQGGKCQTY
jgi:hypothetical protein